MITSGSIGGARVDPVATTALATLLALDFERRHLINEPERRRRTMLVDALLAPSSPSAARATARSAGLTGADAVVGCVDADGVDGQDLAAATRPVTSPRMTS
ncbi:hypothetical protein [Streptosporangium sandarakinum]|uniref:hypothetical protein n=1 Tax=Streptosporangium sandarakinum TaxID=1260955 RepID=UPI00370F892E